MDTSKKKCLQNTEYMNILFIYTKHGNGIFYLYITSGKSKGFEPLNILGGLKISFFKNLESEIKNVLVRYGTDFFPGSMFPKSELSL